MNGKLLSHFLGLKETRFHLPKPTFLTVQKGFIFLLFIYCSACSLFHQEEDASEKMYVFVNIAPAFTQTSDLVEIPESGFIPGMIVESAAENLIEEFWLSTIDGKKTYINPAKIHTPFSTSSFDNYTPIEIPLTDYQYYGLTIASVASRLQLVLNSGVVETVEISATETFTNQEFAGLYVTDNHQPIYQTSKSRYIGKDGAVYKLDIALDALNKTIIDKKIEGTQTITLELENESKAQLSLLNPKEPNQLDCLIGKWERTTCNGEQKSYITFNDNGTAVFEDITCDGDCEKTFNFRYSLVTDSQLNIIYTSSTICGAVGNIPDGGTEYFICDGETLDFRELYTKL